MCCRLYTSKQCYVIPQSLGELLLQQILKNAQYCCFDPLLSFAKKKIIRIASSICQAGFSFSQSNRKTIQRNQVTGTTDVLWLQDSNLIWIRRDWNKKPFKYWKKRTRFAEMLKKSFDAYMLFSKIVHYNLEPWTYGQYLGNRNWKIPNGQLMKMQFRFQVARGAGE